MAGDDGVGDGWEQSELFLIGALVISQGSAAIPLLALGLVLSWFALPGWTELVLMWPQRVGGIAATCAEAFRPYSPVLANLTGVCYWWGWIPTCGLTAILSASALHQWYLPGVPVQLLAIVLVVTFTAINLCGVRWVSRLAVPIAFGSALLALLSAVVPVVAGVDVPPDDAVPGCIRELHQRDGGPLPDWLCRSGLRSGRVSRG